MKCRPSAIAAILLAFLMMSSSLHAQSPPSGASQTSQAVTAPSSFKVDPYFAKFTCNGLIEGFDLYDDGGQSLGYRDGSDAEMIGIRTR